MSGVGKVRYINDSGSGLVINAVTVHHDLSVVSLGGNIYVGQTSSDIDPGTCNLSLGDNFYAGIKKSGDADDTTWDSSSLWTYQPGGIGIEQYTLQLGKFNSVR